MARHSGNNHNDDDGFTQWAKDNAPIISITLVGFTIVVFAITLMSNLF